MNGTRLSKIAAMLPKCDTIADIGCDHGKLAALLIANGVCKRVIAVDISPFSVDKTRKLMNDKDISDAVDIRLGDGFCAIENDEAQCAVLAGLGGELIAKLIERGKDKADGMTLLLQPMQQAEILRAYLKESEWRVIDEAMVEDNGRIHEMMLVEKGKFVLPDGAPIGTELEIGCILWERADPLLIRRLRMRSEAIKRRLMGATDAPGAERKRLAYQVASLAYAAELLERRRAERERVSAEGEQKCI